MVNFYKSIQRLDFGQATGRSTSCTRKRAQTDSNDKKICEKAEEALCTRPAARELIDTIDQSHCRWSGDGSCDGERRGSAEQEINMSHSQKVWVTLEGSWHERRFQGIHRLVPLRPVLNVSSPLTGC
ncbi:hypothetical protein M758_1G061800 [Ceratodon purpureus]|nr:hypothetical protein M758_1G061800 [Ceratodon purpureus]